jgi:hypothetical protein
MSWNDDRTRMVLGLVVIGGFLMFVFLLAFRPVNLTETVLGMLIGYLSANANTVVQFYFGSSSGSKKKDSPVEANEAK